MRLLIKRISILFLCFQFAYFPIFANAMPWDSIKATATSAGASVTGSSTVGGAARSASATVPWNSVRPGMARGLAGAAGLLAIAVDLGLHATDYVLDPANNSIRYKDPIYSTNPYAAYFIEKNSTSVIQIDVFGDTKEDACSAWFGYFLKSYPDAATHNVDGSTCYIHNATGGQLTQAAIRSNPAYDQTKPSTNTATITVPDLIQRLIDQMGNNDAAIKNVLDQILETSIAQAQTATNIDADLKAMLAAITAALDKSAAYPAVGTATGTQTTTATGSNLKIEFPVFCGWAGIVCEAAQTAINFPIKVEGWWNTLTEWNKTLTGWYDAIISKTDGLVDSVKDYFKDPEPDTEDHTVDIDNSTIDKPNINVSFGGSACPSYTVNFNLGYVQRTVDLSPVYLCQIADGMRPFVIAAGLYTAALIVGKREN